MPAALAGACGALGLGLLAGRAGAGAPRAAAVLIESFARAGREGRDPGAGERRRLLAAGGLAGVLTGAVVAGPVAAVGLGAGAPLVVSRALRAGRDRYRGELDTGCAGMALAVADALAGGHSLRAALAEASRSTPGATGHELRRTVSQLGAGASTEHALEALGRRARSERVSAFVAACILQGRIGGDLAGLLRDSAAAMEEQARLEGELRAATEQARFTGLLVILLPAAGAVLAELASPGWLAGLLGSFLTAWLAGIALALQAVAAVLIRRLARPERR